ARDVVGIGNIARPDAARREAAHQARPDIEVVDDLQSGRAAEAENVARLEAQQAGEIVADRIVVAGIQRLAQEVRIAAKSGYVLLEVRVEAFRRILVVV